MSKLKKNLDILKLQLKHQCQYVNDLLGREAIMFDNEGNLIVERFDIFEEFIKIYTIKQEIKELENESNSNN